MLIFISGGVRSGKSTLGEKLADEISKGDKVYLATSMAYDKEMMLRIATHQKNRENKGFITIEKSHNIGEIASSLKSTDTVLLDCLGTLTANEMFTDSSKVYDEKLIAEVVGRIFSDIVKIKAAISNLIIISNELFSDGITYGPATEKYIEVLGSLHIEIANISDRAIECAYGSQTVHKG